MKKRIFYDVDTQNDFMNKDGALYVTGAELIKPNLKLLTDYAKKNSISILGSVDRHFGIEGVKHLETELARWGGPFPDHCMANTKGELKIQETGGREICSHHDPTFDRWMDWSHEPQSIYVQNPLIHQIAFDDYKTDRWGPIKNVVRDFDKLAKGNYKILFEKQHYDVFTNSYTEELLKRTKVKEAVVYGVATDYCVKAAVLGMQDRGIQCYVVEDAIKGVDPETTKSALEEMVEAGAKLVTTDEVVKGEL